MNVVLAVVLLVLVGVYALARRLAPARWWIAVVSTASVTAVVGAFFTSVAVAMASAVDPGVALARGLVGGFLVGAVVGLVCRGAELLWHELGSR